MVEVEDAASGVELQPTGRTNEEYVRGAADSVPFFSAGVPVGEALGEYTITKLRAGLGGENAPGVGEVITASTEVALATTECVAEAAGEITSIADDPIGWVASAGVDMLLSVVTPLQNALHYVAGDGPALRKGAGNFNSIAAGLLAMGDNLVKVGDDRLKAWRGEAAGAGKQALAEFTDGIDGASAVSIRVAEVLESSAILMESVEAVIKSLITDLVKFGLEKLAAAFAISPLTFGASVAAAWASVMAKVAQTFPRVMKYVQKATEIIGLIGKFLGKVKHALDSIFGKVLGKALFAGMSTYVRGKVGGPSLGALKSTSVDKGEDAFATGAAFDAVKVGTGLVRDRIDLAFGDDEGPPDVDDAPNEEETRAKLDSF